MEPCQVLTGYFAGARKFLEDGPSLYESYLSRLEDLEEALICTQISRALQHQRAFSCLHILLRTVVFERMKLANMPTEGCAFSHKEARSREDLNQLIQWLRGVEEEVIGEQTEFEIARRVLSAGATLGVQQIHYEHRTTLHSLVKLLLETCVIVRRALFNPDTRLFRVGNRLFQATSLSGFSVQRMLDLPAIILLNTKEVQDVRT